MSKKSAVLPDPTTASSMTDVDRAMATAAQAQIQRCEAQLSLLQLQHEQIRAQMTEHVAEWQKITKRYAMNDKDRVDLKTGKITRDKSP
jgi:hypothetical protein